MSRLDEIKKDFLRQEGAIQGAVANPKRYLSQDDFMWLLIQAEKLEAINRGIERK